MSHSGSGGPRRPADDERSDGGAGTGPGREVGPGREAGWPQRPVPGQAPGSWDIPRQPHYSADEQWRPHDQFRPADEFRPRDDPRPAAQLGPQDQYRLSEPRYPWEQHPRPPRLPRSYHDDQFYDQQQLPDTHNPRTGADYRRGDDYGIPPARSRPLPARYTSPPPPPPPLSLPPPPAGQGQFGGPGQPGSSGYSPGPAGQAGQAGPPGPPRPPRPPGSGRRKRGPGPFRAFFRRPVGRGVLVLLLAVCCWLAFSVGQALTAPGGGNLSSRMAEWARDHYLGPAVTFGEWLTYQPPKVGGKPQFSMADPQGKLRLEHERGFVPYLPKRLASPAGDPLPGEGEWRLVESVHGEPAIFTTFLRVDAVHTSYVAGLASMDQRLVTFHLHPGAQDPGEGFGGVASWIPPGVRTGLIATFNGGFKLDSAGGGFYLNGATRGTLTPGVASVVYYRNGTITVGNWERGVHMTADVVGVRQNLKLIVDHGEVPATVDQDVESSWGATLGGAYDVWRSGIGVTGNGRVIFVYGPALSVHSLADLLKRAGAVEGMQLDINPYWMSYEHYEADGHPSNPAPVNLLPTQQQTAFRYYSVYSRDFTAVYAR